MNSDGPKYRAALGSMGKSRPQFISPPPEFAVWLLDHSIPEPLVDFLTSNALATDVPFSCGSGGMWTPDDIVALNDQEPAMLQADLLAVGNTTNGDFIVINLVGGVDEVGFVSHDELWEPTTDKQEAREFYCPVDRSLAALLLGMTAEDARWRTHHQWELIQYPIDYSSALARRGNHSDS